MRAGRLDVYIVLLSLYYTGSSENVGVVAMHKTEHSSNIGVNIGVVSVDRTALYSDSDIKITATPSGYDGYADVTLIKQTKTLTK